MACNLLRRAGLWTLVVATVGIAGCHRSFLENGLLDQTQMGRFGNRAIINPILESVTLGDEANAAYPMAEPPTTEDLLPGQGDLRIGPGDTIDITVFELFGENVATPLRRQVSADGYVSLPMVDQVYVAGMTSREVEQAIADKYSPRYIQDPEVSVVLMQSRQNSFTIIGAIPRAGQYALVRQDFRLLDALALAGDTINPQMTDFIYIIRPRYPSSDTALDVTLSVPGRGSGPVELPPIDTLLEEGPITPMDSGTDLLEPQMIQPLELGEDIRPDLDIEELPAEPEPSIEIETIEVPQVGEPGADQLDTEQELEQLLESLEPIELSPIQDPEPQSRQSIMMSPFRLASASEAVAVPIPEPVTSQSVETEWTESEESVTGIPVPEPISSPISLEELIAGSTNAASGDDSTGWTLSDSGVWVYSGRPGTDSAGRPLDDAAADAIERMLMDDSTLTAEQSEQVRLGFDDLPGQRVIAVPYSSELRRGNLAYNNVVIRPGDTIHVADPTVGEFYMMGNVNRPGVYSLTNRRLTLKQAVAAAGNLNVVAIPQRLELIRRIGRSQEVILRFDLAKIFAGEQPDIFLKPNDIINVGTNALAPFLAVMRNAFRFTYGFGFVFDRNFASPDPFNQEARNRRAAEGRGGFSPFSN